MDISFPRSVYSTNDETYSEKYINNIPLEEVLRRLALNEAYEEVKHVLLEFLVALDPREATKQHVVCTPSFYLDHFVSVDDVGDFCRMLDTKCTAGGGNIPGFVQTVLPGGGGNNTAIGLARLGISSHFIGRTSELGYHVLKFFAERSGVDISHVKTDGRLGQTLALEIGQKKVNVMLNDVGSNYDFDFESLRDTDLELIETSHLMSVHDWGTNVIGGTDLAERGFAYAKQYGVTTYFDSADPSPRLADVPDLFRRIISSTDLDIMSMNQNELQKHTGHAHIEHAIEFKRQITARIDYHSPHYAVSLDDEVTVFPTFDVDLHRSTGAGDAWNSGNICGELLGLSTAHRLCLANAVAGFYVSSRRGAHPTIDDVVTFIRTQKLRYLPRELEIVR